MRVGEEPLPPQHLRMRGAQKRLRRTYVHAGQLAKLANGLAKAGIAAVFQVCQPCSPASSLAFPIALVSVCQCEQCKRTGQRAAFAARVDATGGGANSRTGGCNNGGAEPHRGGNRQKGGVPASKGKRKQTGKSDLRAEDPFSR